jgi:hypothetical protein
VMERVIHERSGSVPSTFSWSSFPSAARHKPMLHSSRTGRRGRAFTGSYHRAARRAAETLTQGALAGRVLIWPSNVSEAEVTVLGGRAYVVVAESGTLPSASASSLNRHRLRRRFTHLPLRRGAGYGMCELPLVRL